MANGGASVVTTSGGQPPNGNLEKRVAAIEAVLPTLATKADLAELRADMRSDNDKLRADMRLENDKLRADMRSENDKLRAEFRERIALLHEQLRAEIAQMQASLFRWMVGTLLTMLIAFSAFFIGLGNVLMSRLPSPNSAQASGAKFALATTVQRPNPSP